MLRKWCSKIGLIWIKNMIISLMLYTFKSCSNIKISYEKIEVILKAINTEA